MRTLQIFIVAAFIAAFVIAPLARGGVDDNPEQMARIDADIDRWACADGVAAACDVAENEWVPYCGIVYNRATKSLYIETPKKDGCAKKPPPCEFYFDTETKEIRRKNEPCYFPPPKTAEEKLLDEVKELRARVDELEARE